MSDPEAPAPKAGRERSAPAPLVLRKPIEQWRDEKKTADWLYAGVFVMLGGVQGKELTEAEYDAACHKHATTPIGYRVLGLRGER